MIWKMPQEPGQEPVIMEIPAYGRTVTVRILESRSWSPPERAPR